ncbi:MAG TPA: hypothetical protein VIH57_10300, partial [Bacteroidales bacterium]
CDYVSESEEALLKLKNAVLKERYQDSIKIVFDALALKIRHNKRDDLETYKEEISELLQEEIMSRYYFQRGRIQISLNKDLLVQKSIELLKNKTLYSNILQGLPIELAVVIKKKLTQQ